MVIHPNGFTEAKRFTRFYFNNVIGNPLETTIALHYLIFDGVLERHPEPEDPRGARRRLSRRPIRAASITPGARARTRTATCRKPPTELSQEDLFRHAWCSRRTSSPSWCSLFGADRIIMGTDYPFDMADFDPIGHVASVEGFDPSTVAAIAGGNAKRLLRGFEAAISRKSENRLSE